MSECQQNETQVPIYNTTRRARYRVGVHSLAWGYVNSLV